MKELERELLEKLPKFIEAVEVAVRLEAQTLVLNVDEFHFKDAELFYKCMKYASAREVTVELIPHPMRVDIGEAAN